MLSASRLAPQCRGIWSHRTLSKRVSRESLSKTRRGGLVDSSLENTRNGSLARLSSSKSKLTLETVRWCWMSSSKANSSFTQPRGQSKTSQVSKPKEPASEKEHEEVIVPTKESEPQNFKFNGLKHSNASEAAKPKPSRKRRWLKYALMVGGVLGMAYVVTEANENPSWWYQSSIHAPYVIMPSGRKLAYNEYGNPLGKDVVLVFHDYLAGRTELEGLGLVDTLKEKKYANVRVIVLDRPGYGQSDKQRHRRLNDWHEDVLRVVDALKIESFSVIGIGAGGLYALSCASLLPPAHPGRLTNVALLGSEAPRLDAFGLPIPTTVKDQQRENFIQDLLANKSWPASLFLRLANIILYSSHSPDFVFGLIYNSETKILAARPEAYRAMVLGTREAWSQGFHAIKNELAVTKDRTPSAAVGYSQINLAKGSRIQLWHGDKDQLVPLPMIQHLAKIIPGAQLHVCRGQGHLSSIVNHWETALDFVITPPPAQLAEIRDNANASL